MARRFALAMVVVLPGVVSRAAEGEGKGFTYRIETAADFDKFSAPEQFLPNVERSLKFLMPAAKFADVANATLRRKQARQAARAILPNATETRIVVTGNYRAWRHFIAMRATEHADVEIRELAVECLRHLQKAAANVFADFTISTLPDGTEIATSPKVFEG